MATLVPLAPLAEVTEALERVAQFSKRKHGLEVVRLSMKIDAIHNPRSGFMRQLRKPLTLRAVRELGYWIVSDRITLAYRTAPELGDAVVDYMVDWEDRLRWLEEDEPSLALVSVQELATLRRLLA